MANSAKTSQSCRIRTTQDIRKCAAEQDIRHELIESRTVGVETDGSNIQFGPEPDNGRMVSIEMNPRVSRSSALAQIFNLLYRRISFGRPARVPSTLEYSPASGLNIRTTAD